MGLLVSTRAAVLGCSTGEADRTYLMLRAAFRSLKGTLRMVRSPRMMAGTSRRSGMCSTGGRPRAGICGLIALLVSTRAAVLGCSTGEADRTYLMLRAAFRSLKGTLRMVRSQHQVR